MKRILNLRNWLLQNDLVEENDYLTRYLELLQLNLTTTTKKTITQNHHAIPVVYYKHFFPVNQKGRSRHLYERMAREDPNNFLVNLKYSDHLLAHCYLALCAKPTWFKFANANMITVVSKYTELKEFVNLKSLEEFQKAYTLSCQLKQGKTLTKEHKAKIAASHNRSEEYSKKIADANRRRVWKQDSKDKISKIASRTLTKRNKETPPAKGLVWVSNGTHITRVKKDEIPKYLSLGYWLGKTSTLKIRKSYTEIIIHSKDWPAYEVDGWKKGWKLPKQK